MPLRPPTTTTSTTARRWADTPVGVGPGQPCSTSEVAPGSRGTNGAMGARVRILIAVVLLGTGCAGVGDRGPECKAYVTCYEATGGVKGALDSTYGTMGTCWTTTDQAADTCKRACDLAIKDLQRAFPDAGCVDK